MPHTCTARVGFELCNVYSRSVPRNLKRYHGAGDLHFVTFSCYRRLTLLDFTHSYNSNGTASSVANNQHTNRPESYTYNTLNRLATAQSQATSGGDCWGQSYGYDRYASLTSISVTQCSALALGLSVNTSTDQITNPGYRYDAAGNMLSDGWDAYTWNGSGRMSAAAGYSDTHDGDGLRVEKSIDGHQNGDENRNPDQRQHNTNGKLYWYGLSDEALAESDLAGNITSEYIYFGGRRIARRDPGRAAFQNELEF